MVISPGTYTGLRGIVVEGDKEVHKKLKVKWVWEADEWKKSQLNEKAKDGEVDFTLILRSTICEPTSPISMVCDLFNFETKLLIPTCLNRNLSVGH